MGVLPKCIGNWGLTQMRRGSVEIRDKIIGRVLDPSIFWLRAAACFYAPGLFYAMLALLRRRNIAYAVARETFRVGVILHGVAIVDLGMAIGRLPVENFFQTLSLCAFLIAVLFLMVEWRYH